MTATRAPRGYEVVNVKDHGVKGDGSTNDSAAITALAAATSQGTLYFPHGTYKVDTTTLIDQPNLHLLGDSATLDATTGIGLITVSDCASLTGFTVDSIRLAINSTISGPVLLEDNTFTGTSGGAVFGVNDTAGTWPNHVKIINNNFTDHDYGIYGSFSNTLIHGNTFTGAFGSARRNIELGVGSGNRITDNHIDGGVTAVIWLTQRGRGNQNSVDNVISGNTIENISEEGISTDLQGNQTGKSGSVITGTISSGLTTSGGYVQFIPSFSLAVANAYLDLYVVMMTGKAKGEVSKITSQGSGGTTHLETTATNISGYTVGDRFVLVCGFHGFTITNNTVRNVQTGINHWGCTYGSVIANNTIFDCSLAGIKISSLFGVIDGTYGPCYNNTVTANTLKNANLTINASGPASSTNRSIGNTVYGNTLLGASQLGYSDQEGYQVWDNTIFGNYGYSYTRTVDFESGTVAANFDTVSDPGSKLTIDSVVFNGGAKSLKKATGNTATGTLTIPAGERLITTRFAFYMTAWPAGGPALIAYTCAGTAFLELDVGSDGTLKLFCGSATPVHPASVLAASTWYWIDMQVDVRTSTFATYYTVTRISDSVTISRSSKATGSLTPADITAVIIGDGTALDANYDDIQVTNSTNYPLVLNIPSIPADGSWQLGQQVYVASPVSGGNIGYVCTTAGNPGTWKAFGTIA